VHDYIKISYLIKENRANGLKIVLMAKQTRV